MRGTYPVPSESGACALRLHTPEERKMAEFGKNQQQHPLHTLGRHLNGWKTFLKNKSHISMVNQTCNGKNLR